MAYYNAKQRLKELLGSYSAEEEKLGQIYKTALENAENSYKASLDAARAEAERKRKEARREQGRARTFEELLAIGKAKGYKNPAYWARKVLQGRK